MKANINWKSGLKILVVGDVILDRYWEGDASRVSPEAPVPVVHVNNVTDRAGGAGNVAVNIKRLEGGVCLLGVIGDDVEGEVLKGILSSIGVQTRLFYSKNKKTSTKLRVSSRNQQLVRADFEEKYEVEDVEAFLVAYEELLLDCDLVVLSDYMKGTLNLVQDIIRIAKEKRKVVLVDPKGDCFSKYANASILTPNRFELERIVGKCSTDRELEVRAKELVEQIGVDYMLVTRGEEGMSLFPSSGAPLHLSAHAKEVYDVTGAGDTVIATLAVALSSGQSIEDAVVLANIAAGMVVTKAGAASVSRSEIEGYLRSGVQAKYSGLLTETDLMAFVNEARAMGERIVMTNGCFDILHAGHVEYLKEAKKLGDRLIVAVNNDDSVGRLKGNERPINSLNDRVTLLSALGVVDWVVVFDSDTPLDIYKKVLPDVLVKGGDYKGQDVAGALEVRNNGGEVVFIDFIPGYSTSSLVDKIRRR